MGEPKEDVGKTGRGGNRASIDTRMSDITAPCRFRLLCCKQLLQIQLFSGTLDEYVIEDDR